VGDVTGMIKLFDFRFILGRLHSPVCIALLGTFLVTIFGVDKPSNAESVILTQEYRSVFDKYDDWEWLDFEDWQKANDNVGNIGGWQFYAREAEDIESKE